MKKEAFVLKCKNCGPLEHVNVDGYGVGDRLLEGVMFYVRPGKKPGTWKAEVYAADKEYFSELNEKKWLKAIEQEVADSDTLECCKCGADIDGPAPKRKARPLKLKLVNLKDLVEGRPKTVKVQGFQNLLDGFMQSPGGAEADGSR